MISPGNFFIFSKFWFFGLLVGWNGKKWSKMTKHCLLCSISQEPYIIWFSFMVHMCKMMTFPGVFFTFSKFWYFRLLGRGTKGWSKLTKFSLSRHISQGPCIIWLLFVVHKCKIIFPGFFFVFAFVFQNFDFSGWQKIVQNGKTLCLPGLISLEPYIIWWWFLVHSCKMMISPEASLSFSKFLFSGFLGGWDGGKMKKCQQIMSYLLCISGTVPRMIVAFGTGVKWWYLQYFCPFFKILFF